MPPSCNDPSYADEAQAHSRTAPLLGHKHLDSQQADSSHAFSYAFRELTCFALYFACHASRHNRQVQNIVDMHVLCRGKLFTMPLGVRAAITEISHANFTNFSNTSSVPLATSSL